MAELTEEAMEIVADAAEEVSNRAEDLAHAARAMSATKIRFFAAGVMVGAAVGGLVSYRFAYQKADAKYDKIANQEIMDARERFNERLAKVAGVADDKPSPEAIVEHLGYRAASEQAKETAENEAVITKNIFDATENISEWDYAVEMDSRKRKTVYIVHRDENLEGGGDEYDASTLTYFAGDDVLCDERDSQIDNVDEMVGLLNLERFGHGSEDPNVLYIRNEDLKLDIEIVKSEGTYAKEVHGFEPPDEDSELKHSDRRWRPRDDE